jgi:hypothetical protein
MIQYSFYLLPYKWAYSSIIQRQKLRTGLYKALANCHTTYPVIQRNLQPIAKRIASEA